MATIRQTAKIGAQRSTHAGTGLAGPAPSAKWYVRPPRYKSSQSTPVYGTGDGTSYANAWTGERQIDYSQVSPGDTIYFAGHHYVMRSFLSGRDLCNLNVGGTDQSGLRLQDRGFTSNAKLYYVSCETQYGASTDDPAYLYGYSKVDTDEWTGPDGSGVYSLPASQVTYIGSLSSFHNGIEQTSINLLPHVATYAECAATAGSFCKDTTAGFLYYHPTSAVEPLLLLNTGEECIKGGGNQNYEIKGFNIWGLFKGGGSWGYTGDVTPDYDPASRHVSSNFGFRECTFKYTRDRCCNAGDACTDFYFIDNLVEDCWSGCYHYDGGYYNAARGDDKNQNFTITGNTFRSTTKIKNAAHFLWDLGDRCAVASQGGIRNLTCTDNIVIGWLGDGLSFFPATWDPANYRTQDMANTYLARNWINIDTLSFDNQPGVCLQLSGNNYAAHGYIIRDLIIENNICSDAVFWPNTGTEDFDSTYTGGVRLKGGWKNYESFRESGMPIIRHNTFYNNNHGIYVRGNPNAPANDCPMKVYNNIFLDSVDGGNAYSLGHHIHFDSNTFDGTNFRADNNIYSGDGTFYIMGQPEMTLAAWKTYTGQDASSVDTDPALNITNPSPYDETTDFRLTASSTAAIDQGSQQGTTDDYDGNARDASPDIGADEY